MVQITNIRYAHNGQIAFDYNGVTHYFREPNDVILVGSNPDAAARWIWSRYGMLL